MKVQPCIYLYTKIYNFLFEEVFQFMYFLLSKTSLNTKKKLLWIIKIKDIFKILMIPCPHNHQYMFIHKFSK